MVLSWGAISDPETELEPSITVPSDSVAILLDDVDINVIVLPRLVPV